MNLKEEQWFIDLCRESELSDEDIESVHKIIMESEDEADDFSFWVAYGELEEKKEKSALWAFNMLIDASEDVVGLEFADKRAEKFTIVLPNQSSSGYRIAHFDKNGVFGHKDFQSKNGISEYLVEEGMRGRSKGVYEQLSSDDEFILRSAALMDGNKEKVQQNLSRVSMKP